MALEALVTVEIKAIRDVPASVTKRSHAYALVTIGRRRFGRSRKIAAAGTFDLTAEPQPWKLDVPVGAGESIPIKLELWEDRGDDHPDGFATVSGKIPSPWNDGEVEIGKGPKLVVKITTVRVRFARTAVRAKRAPDPAESFGLSIAFARRRVLHSASYSGEMTIKTQNRIRAFPTSHSISRKASTSWWATMPTCWRSLTAS